MARATSAQRGYGARWRRERTAFLARPENRRCACGQPAIIVDHKVPHRGDQRLFWARSNWQPMCKPCHDRTKQREEHRGYSDRMDANGLPTDPRHPFNRADTKTTGGSKVQRSGGPTTGVGLSAELVRPRSFSGAAV